MLRTRRGRETKLEIEERGSLVRGDIGVRGVTFLAWFDRNGRRIMENNGRRMIVLDCGI